MLLDFGYTQYILNIGLDVGWKRGTSGFGGSIAVVGELGVCFLQARCWVGGAALDSGGGMCGSKQ